MQEVRGRDDVPDLQVLRKLDCGVQPCNRANPAAVSDLLYDAAILVGSNLE
jgi:hypothetical protein